jgi:hypothetical protein
VSGLGLQVAQELVMYINWETPFIFNIAPDVEVRVPTYGNFGGPGYTNGSFDPLATPDITLAVDPLDALFAAHDLATGDPSTPQILDDVALVQGIVDLKPNQLDEEASVYAGATTLVYLGQLGNEGALDLFSDKEIAFATKDALHNIGRGIKHWDPAEVLAAQSLAMDNPAGLGFELSNLHGHHGDWLV